MGWYTIGPGDLQYKLGDVYALAKECGLGSLEFIPRLLVEDEEDIIEIDEIEFYALLQEEAIKIGLPWQKKINFDLDDAGEVTEGVEVSFEMDIDSFMQEFSESVLSNIDNIVLVIQEFLDDDNLSKEDIRITLNIEISWSLTEADYPQLIDWINQGLGDKIAPIRLNGLKEGNIEDGWYKAPQGLEDTFSILSNDENRRLALQALGCAVVSGDPLFLDQPGDDYEVEVWGDDEDEDSEDEN